MKTSQMGASKGCIYPELAITRESVTGHGVWARRQPKEWGNVMVEKGRLGCALVGDCEPG